MRLSENVLKEGNKDENKALKMFFVSVDKL